MKNIVIAGASIAGLSAARQLRKSGFTGTVTLVDRDVRDPYRRPEVSKGLLNGKADGTSIAVKWPDDLPLDRVTGVRLTGLDTSARHVAVDGPDGRRELSYDGLVIATGVDARRSPFTPQLDGVHTLRNFDDAHRMAEALRGASSVAIVGGGFIGLEVAAVVREMGKTVTVLEASPRPLGRVLGDVFSDHMATMHRSRDIEILCEATVAELAAGLDGAVCGVRLDDGRFVDADIVLVAIGSAPAVDWLAGAGLDLTDGVRCDSTCAVEGATDIVAAGDVASWWNPLYDRRMRVEHWTNAIEQGTYAARRLLGDHELDGFSSAPYFWSDQYGMRLQSIGTTIGHDRVDVLERDGDRLVVAYSIGGRVTCVAGINAGTAVMSFRKQILDGASADSLSMPVAKVRA
ncbi:NAD(P)/FAD-dependent oxidoreductase [Rhodococcoides kyotonense]|uniref:NADPH-dependent 2,4-dienoyl-CoA reductase, sulfur reductase n=1 Tax=Rhodococcoides kyotonense TaxID=398843 RepID=A0A239M1P1_9NOCA|nr:FAD/NAD(P)-binding oxidoreductase [Rhodococcus kyotonensis]SNT36008.1 NADPH-dependent 2,4-dienoyl-CoA reductase, sulfur reductase [Rhodococcus kyotonensis]